MDKAIRDYAHEKANWSFITMERNTLEQKVLRILAKMEYTFFLGGQAKISMTDHITALLFEIHTSLLPSISICTSKDPYEILDAGTRMGLIPINGIDQDLPELCRLLEDITMREKELVDLAGYSREISKLLTRATQDIGSILMEVSNKWSFVSTSWEASYTYEGDQGSILFRIGYSDFFPCRGKVNYYPDLYVSSGSIAVRDYILGEKDPLYHRGPGDCLFTTTPVPTEEELPFGSDKWSMVIVDHLIGVVEDLNVKIAFFLMSTLPAGHKGQG